MIATSGDQVHICLTHHNNLRLLVEGLTFMLQYPSQFVCIGLNYVEGIAFRRFKLFEISSLLINSDFATSASCGPDT